MRRLFIILLISLAGAPARAGSAADDLRALELMENAAITRYKASAHTAADRAEVEKLTEFYDQLARQYPRDAAVREAYGAFLSQIERRGAAVEQWQIGEKLDPKNAGIAFFLGGAFLDAGDAKKATAYFSRAAELAPKDALYHFNLGNALYLFRHELVEPATPTADAVAMRALAEFRVATKLEPFNEEFAKAYADAFYTVGSPDWKAACDAWQHYLDISANKDFAYTNLARVSLKMGRSDEARNYLQRITSKEFEPARERLLRQAEASAPAKPGL